MIDLENAIWEGFIIIERKGKKKNKYGKVRTKSDLGQKDVNSDLIIIIFGFERCKLIDVNEIGPVVINKWYERT